MALNHLSPPVHAPSSSPPRPYQRTHSSISTLPPPSRLLLPRIRVPRVSSSGRSSSRARSASLSDSHSSRLPSSSFLNPHATALEWLGLPLDFDVVHDQLEIEGYQMYAVEKWIVERNRPITVLTVYTGDPSHKITVTALAPSSTLSDKDAAHQWEQALLHLRRDASARPKQTPYGVLMTTSLAYFRSDYTIVQIPHGNFLLAKDQLYANINLLRMGCGGRSALSLEEPSETTKERFISTYRIPEMTLPSTLPMPFHHYHHHHYRHQHHPAQAHLQRPRSSDHLTVSTASHPVSASSSMASRDTTQGQDSSAHLAGSKSSRVSTLHQRSFSYSHSPQLQKRSNLSKKGTEGAAGKPSIHVTAPTPTVSDSRGESVPGSPIAPSPIKRSTSNSGLLGTTTLALLASHARAKTKDLPFFNATVLELVKLVQVGLALFGMYDVREPGASLDHINSNLSPAVVGLDGLLIDGLLCDVTVRGIERWIAEVGEPRVGLEPAERIADPMFVSALLSLVLSIRNKLAALGPSNIVPKDPFLHPQAFSQALASYLSGVSHPPSAASSPTLPPSSNQYASPAMLPAASHPPPHGSGSLFFKGTAGMMVTTVPFAAAAFLNSHNNMSGAAVNSPSLSLGPASTVISPGGSANSSSIQVQVDTPPNSHHCPHAVLTREVVDAIEVAWANLKRVTGSGETSGGKGVMAGTGEEGDSSGAVTVAGGSPAAAGSSGTGVGSAGTQGSGPQVSFSSNTESPSAGHTRRKKVRRVLKEKLEKLEDLVVPGVVGESHEGTSDLGFGVSLSHTTTLDDTRDNANMSAGEGDGYMSVGSTNASVSTGGHILRGMGNLLLSGAGAAAMNIGLGAHGMSGGGLACIWEATPDLDRFVLSVMERGGGKKKSVGGGGVGATKKRRKAGKSGKRMSESVDLGKGLGISYGYYNKHSQSPASGGAMEVGLSVSMLWSGRVADVVALRLWERERERKEERADADGGADPGSTGIVVMSDGDGEGVRSDGAGGRSTEGEESDLQMHYDGRAGMHGSGNGWGGRVQRTLGNWTGLSKRKGYGSVDMSHLPSLTSVGKQSRSGGRFSLQGTRSPSTKDRQVRSRTQSPTLQPLIVSGVDREDDLVSEGGQVSPSSDHKPNQSILPSAVYLRRRLDDEEGSPLRGVGPSAAHWEMRQSGGSGSGSLRDGEGSRNRSIEGIPETGLLGPVIELKGGRMRSPIIGEDLDDETNNKDEGEEKGTGTEWRTLRMVDTKLPLNLRRPEMRYRIASWADPRSAWNEEVLGLRPSEATESTGEEKRATVGSTSRSRDGADSGSENDPYHRSISKNMVRRRSFHDLESLSGMSVLSLERMRIDVELCAQLLIMVRREEHLLNVIATLETLTSTLSTTNDLLRSDYETHVDALADINSRARVIADIDAQLRQADQITQASNTLQYESAQFLIPEVWHTASLSRTKVLELREKVFGMGGRRLPPGKYGAHGRFNRVQWTLDGKRRLVDHLGRTEEEAKEEERIVSSLEGEDGRRLTMAREDGEEDGDVVEHASIKPMWLLRFFTSWGARWSALKVAAAGESIKTE